jgi:hypothetical protein
VGVQVSLAGVVQDGMSPFTCTCLACGEVWEPTPARGKSEVTDASLDTSVKNHWKVCRGPSVEVGVG